MYLSIHAGVPHLDLSGEDGAAISYDDEHNDKNDQHCKLLHTIPLQYSHEAILFYESGFKFLLIKHHGEVG